MTRHRKATLGVASLVLFAVVAAAAAGQSAARPVAAGGGSPGLLVPHESWPCGLAGGIMSPETGTLLFTAVMPLERVADIGRTPYGRRQVAVTQQGTLTGGRLSGTVMTSGLDFELTLANGVREVEQIFVLRSTRPVIRPLNSPPAVARRRAKEGRTPAVRHHRSR